MHPAKLWRPLTHHDADPDQGTFEPGTVQCLLCNHFCRIEPGLRGQCGVRQNQDGELMTLVKDRVAALNLDPVEKKPLYHFLPGTMTLSLGTMGCNLSCDNCQNHSLSQSPREGRPIQGQAVTSEELVQGAIKAQAQSISYTYSEPTIFFELMLDTAILAHEQGLKNIIVSNGFMSPQCMEELAPVIDAANIDLKSFNDGFYRKFCSARLKPVLSNLVQLKKAGVWLEITTLLIPEHNDSYTELADIAVFIHDELGAATPWHISRFHPDFRMPRVPPTPEETLERAWDIGREAGLEYVYVGNVPGHLGNNTFCPDCCRMTVSRRGFAIARADAGGKCQNCGHAIPGVGMEGLDS
ncbi:MAG: AmmeMemoRadiSam system radical SAM enzyme [Desulfovibrio sp.]|nr:MAG: AmmeMemoRadiSam system radical SAM enzyme [Desulfovibrio sp.]